uniref:3-hydroxyanthranilate 3,4-dioxygenase-like n=1 Tax=Styela clava TaxID=7725 RepID=UPI001939B858|nr:3-hydroxyanthranilate 3,4-dioxygenase-like [Styela clava]
MSTPGIINVGQWIEENKNSFDPPVCNKMMHNGQLKVMFVGGPNERKDYHHEEGEELFYMVKGDMCLKILEKGKHKDVVIKEGEVFLLPARIPHSPQRKENTVGLVIERDRLDNETDGLRYYTGDTTQVLFERWFHCYDLGSELVPIIKEYFASEEHKTGKPNPDKLMKELPFEIDEKTEVMKPMSFDDWIKRNNKNGDSVPLFGGKYQFDIKIYFEGETKMCEINTEYWIWQIEGESTITGENQSYNLKKGDSVLLESRTGFIWKREANSSAMCVIQDGSKK